MVALNANTGKRDPGFGQEGEMTMDVPFAGRAFGLQEGLPGDSRACDARRGKKLWEFHAIPRPGEPGHKYWAEAAATTCGHIR
ncbi:MAG: hypothetical protein JO307_13150 [Bryobacterales bacterium]|nr:hypothetical protein [Bryobacterales bacterium]